MFSRALSLSLQPLVTFLVSTIQYQELLSAKLWSKEDMEYDVPDPWGTSRGGSLPSYLSPQSLGPLLDSKD